MVNVKRWVTARTQFRGLHHWPNCPLDEVGFLRDPHRHTFHVMVSVEVSGADREVEFFVLQRKIDDILSQKFSEEDDTLILGARSCEMMADEIYDGLQNEFGGGGMRMRISISEDGENEALCEYC